MSAGGALEVRAARPADVSALSALFERSGSGCFCRYWHFGADKNAWLHRLAHEPQQNAAELSALLGESSGEPSGEPSGELRGELQGVVAQSAAAAVGWMKLVRAERVPKLYEQRVYRNLPCFGGDRRGTLSVGCFLIDPEWRRQGVARALLREGIRVARERGARAIEAFPRRGEHLGDAEMWTGPLSLFEEEGFEFVSDFEPYPVLRCAL